MKKSMVLICFGAALYSIVCTTPLTAQEVVFNGDFETASYTSFWALYGGNDNTTIAQFETVLGKNSWCLQRRPGIPNDNGGIQQKVHLFAGIPYAFRADIAVVECG